MERERIPLGQPLFDVRLVGRHASAEDRARTLAAQRERQAAELAAAHDAGYRQGRAEADAAFAGQLMMQRQEVSELAEGVLRRLHEQERALAQQARACVPGLVMNIVRRLLAGAVSAPERIERIIEQALAEAPSNTEQALEVSLSPGDFQRFEAMTDGGLRARYPQITLQADPALAPNDCLVRGGFGLIDARLETKLKAVEQLFAAS